MYVCIHLQFAVAQPKQAQKVSRGSLGLGRLGLERNAFIKCAHTRMYKCARICASCALEKKNNFQTLSLHASLAQVKQLARIGD